MVNVKFVGGIGNNLFQYSAGRIIAQKLGLLFQVKYTGCALDKIATHLGLDSYVGYGPSLPSPLLDLPPEAQTLDWKKINKFRGNVVVRGYLQGDPALYDNHYDDILSWVLDSPQKTALTATNTMAVHVRLGDYKPLGWVAPLEYYEQAVRKDVDSFGKPDRVVFITDEPENIFIAELVGRISSVVGDGSIGFSVPDLPEIESFDLMRYSRTLICPCSTFSWWAGYLGEGRVYCPLPTSGFWSSSSDVNLRTSVPRFDFVPCGPAVRLPVSNLGYHHTKEFK